MPVWLGLLLPKGRLWPTGVGLLPTGVGLLPARAGLLPTGVGLLPTGVGLLPMYRAFTFQWLHVE